MCPGVAILAATGRIDVLVNNAGHGHQDHPLPFRKSANANVVIGWILLVLAVTVGRLVAALDSPIDRKYFPYRKLMPMEE